MKDLPMCEHIETSNAKKNPKIKKKEKAKKKRKRK